MKKIKAKHGVVSRKKAYVNHDCYAYEVTCLCGKVFYEWSAKETEDKIKKHIASFPKSNKPKKK